MESRKKSLLGIVGVLILAAIGIGMFSRNTTKETYTAGPGFYYTGVRFNHNTGQFVSGDNKVVPPPAGVTPAQLAKMRTESKSSQVMRAKVAAGQ